MTATLTRPAAPAARTAYRVPALDVVIPVSGEQHDLETCVRQLHAYLTDIFPLPFRITIAGHATAIPARAEILKAALPEVRVAHLPEKERGQALRTAWLQSDALVLASMDADRSIDLSALLPLVAPLLSGHSDLAIGTRLARTARVARGPGREFVSRGYRVLLHWMLRTRFSDAQCGFKAIRREVAQRLLPLVEDTGRFFDTELLVLAERAGLRIAEVPVDWAAEPGRRAGTAATALAGLRSADLWSADLRSADLRRADLSRADLSRADLSRADLWSAVRLSRALAARRRPIAALRAQIGRAPLTSPPARLASGLAGT